MWDDVIYYVVLVLLFIIGVIHFSTAIAYFSKRDVYRAPVPKPPFYDLARAGFAWPLFLWIWSPWLYIPFILFFGPCFIVWYFIHPWHKARHEYEMAAHRLGSRARRLPPLPQFQWCLEPDKLHAYIVRLRSFEPGQQQLSDDIDTSDQTDKGIYNQVLQQARKEARQKFTLENIAVAVKTHLPDIGCTDELAYAAAVLYPTHVGESGEYPGDPLYDEDRFTGYWTSDHYLRYVRKALTTEDAVFMHLLKSVQAAAKYLDPPLLNQGPGGMQFSLSPNPSVATRAIDAFIDALPDMPIFADVKPDHSAFSRLKSPSTQTLYLPKAARLEHHWIVGATGSGKTNALKGMILADIEGVRRRECSLVVIDSQQSLIPEIAGLKIFAPGQPLHGKLVHLDPRDVEFPLALGLFDLNVHTADAVEQIRFQTAAVNLLEFALSSLVEQEVSGPMMTVLRSLVIALLSIPDATIHTMMEMLDKSPKEPFPPHIRPHVEALDPIVRSFFAKQYDTREFQTSKDALQRRLYSLLLNPIFASMFSHPRSKLKLKEEMAAGKVILIDTAKDLFGDEGAELLGRFFIALVGHISAQRTPDTELPCYVYIDEAGDYLSKESGFPRILDQARKKNIGLIVAHQGLHNVAPGTLAALQANTRIRFASVQGDDAFAMARYLNASPEDVKRRERGTFAAYIQDVTPRAVQIKFPFTDLKALPQMTAEERAEVRADMRRRYCEPAVGSRPGAGGAPPEPAPPSSTSPSGKPARW